MSPRFILQVRNLRHRQEQCFVLEPMEDLTADHREVQLPGNAAGCEAGGGSGSEGEGV